MLLYCNWYSPNSDFWPWASQCTATTLTEQNKKVLNNSSRKNSGKQSRMLLQCKALWETDGTGLFIKLFHTYFIWFIHCQNFSIKNFSNIWECKTISLYFIPSQISPSNSSPFSKAKLNYLGLYWLGLSQSASSTRLLFLD